MAISMRRNAATPPRYSTTPGPCSKQGIKFFYHCHGYEFRPFGEITFMDLLMKETDPGSVAFQMDVLWVVHPGQDPVVWLNKYPKRWQLLHLKDLKRGVKGDFSGKSDVTNDVALGKGQMDWPKILKAARRAGVKHYFIEGGSLPAWRLRSRRP